MMISESVQDKTTQELRDLGYESANIVPDFRFTYLDDSRLLRNEACSLAAFAGAPPSMTNACVSVIQHQDEAVGKRVLERLRFLSAPLAVLVLPKQVQLYSLGIAPEPRKIADVSHDQWPGPLRNLGDISPQGIMAAKTGSRQMSFVDAGLARWAEEITAKSLTLLLSRLLGQAISQLAKSHQGLRSAQQAVTRAVFQLFACRVLQDKGVIDEDIDVNTALRQAGLRFSKNLDPTVLESRYLSQRTVASIYEDLRAQFAFASLTSQMLGHAYENALVTPKLRSELGIYYTPECITQYILDRLPIESVEAENRTLLDPCCGSGSFLLAGFRRLRSLLPAEIDPTKAHHYLSQRLLGFDIDPFAREIAALALVLSEPTAKNGWIINDADATSSGSMRGHLRKAPTIIVTNPPFKETKRTGERHEKALEVLRSVLEVAAKDALVGVVLPQSFMESRTAASVRHELLTTCDLLEVGTLPGGMFASNVDTMMLLLRKRPGQSLGPASIVSIRELRAKDIGGFRSHSRFSRTYSADPRCWLESENYRFVISPLVEIWETLATRCVRLADVARVSAGLQVFRDDETSIHDDKQTGDVPVLTRLDRLRQFVLLPPGQRGEKWLAYGVHLRRQGDQAVFKQAKVLINSNRSPGSPWRLVAAVDRRGYFVTDNFHCVSPSDANVTVEEITSVLNSPVANAWLDAHSRQRKIVIRTLLKMPFPRFDPVSRDELVDLVRKLERELTREWQKDRDGLFFAGDRSVINVPECIAEIDRVVYRAYGLSDVDRLRVDKLFVQERRPL